MPQASQHTATDDPNIAATLKVSACAPAGPEYADGRRQSINRIEPRLHKLATKQVAELLQADAVYEAAFAAGVRPERLREQREVAAAGIESGRLGRTETDLAKEIAGLRRWTGAAGEKGGAEGERPERGEGCLQRRSGSRAERHPDASVWSKLAIAK